MDAGGYRFRGLQQVQVSVGALPGLVTVILILTKLLNLTVGTGCSHHIVTHFMFFIDCSNTFDIIVKFKPWAVILLGIVY